MRLRSALLAATILAIPIAAKAQPVTGFYIGAGAGANILNDEYVKRSTAAKTTGGTDQFSQPGFVGLASAGYGLGNGLRFEIEGDYRGNGLEKFTAAPPTSTGPTKSGGNQINYGAMANVLYDFSIGVPWAFPYAGIGAGYSETEFQGFHRYTTNAVPGTTVTTGGSYGNLAYQAIVGVAFPIPAVPGLSVTAEGRFFGVLPDEGFHATRVSGASFSKGNNDITSDNNESVLFGLRYAFGVAPPPPPAAAPVAAPAPAPARTYLVFFDWDKADLTDRAKQIIAQAATASTHVAYTRIEVNGYTDLSGTPQYNQGLSVRRAQSVAAELVKDGVPRTAIDIKGFGETHPLVPTAQGVREPQNRRVEIILH
jgi:outer membrane protein OmpA-like peptidoglycan-associated protein